MSNPYTVLGVARNADQVAIKAAYIQMMRRHHPDRAVGESPDVAGQRAKAINAAFSLLSDPGRRAALDASLDRAAQTPSGSTRRAPPSPAEQRRYQMMLAARQNRLRRVRLFQQGVFVAACLVLGLGIWGAISLFEPGLTPWRPADPIDQRPVPVGQARTDLDSLHGKGP